MSGLNKLNQFRKHEVRRWRKWHSETIDILYEGPSLFDAHTAARQAVSEGYYAKIITTQETIYSPDTETQTV